jgi:outer membrane protein OmpA-like peptidoglycan-associated protein
MKTATTRSCRDLAAICSVVLGSINCSAPGALSAADPAPKPVEEFIVQAFDRYPIVALSEMHGNAESQALVTSLVRNPAFRTAVQDIVVEFGNARHQAVADRYVAGEDVPPEEVKRIWEDTTQISGIFLLPMYGQILAEVRSVNATLPEAERLRVWLGDPPIDWSAVTSGADDDMNDWRDAWFARVVEDRIRAHRRKALLFIGGAHLSRKVMFPNSLIHLLDERRPGETFVVSVIDAGRLDESVTARLRGWPVRVASLVRGTWLGQLDVKSIGFGLSTGRLEQDVDAIVLLSHAPLVYAPPPPIESGSPYGKELMRRQDLARATVPFRGASIRFEAGAMAFSPDAEKPLGEVLTELRRNGALHLLVKAFADGHESDPDGLSGRRANVLVEWLAERGVARERLLPRGCGSRRPLTFGETEAGRALNRRAELVRATPMAGCEPPW